MPRTRKNWIVNPTGDFVKELALSGRFLESDYRIAIKNGDIPDDFDENLEKSDRKFVIIGARSVPMATAKSVFLCLRLAGPESVVIKTATEDEGLLVQNVLDNWTPHGVETKIFSIGSDKLRNYPEWAKYLEEATDIVVFGGRETVDSFIELETRKRNVYIHGPKFSFSIIKAKDLNMAHLNDICDDFGLYYGEGCLSPKFCIIVGKVDPKWYHEASLIMQAEHGDNIMEFRGKLPMAKKSELVQEIVTANVVGKYVRVETLDDKKKLFSPLYGDVRFINVNTLDDLVPFLEDWKYDISTVACLEEEDDIVDLMDEFNITRVCAFGEMQFPEFDEPFDIVDDFDIYCQ